MIHTHLMKMFTVFLDCISLSPCVRPAATSSLDIFSDFSVIRVPTKLPRLCHVWSSKFQRVGAQEVSGPGSLRGQLWSLCGCRDPLGFAAPNSHLSGSHWLRQWCAVWRAAGAACETCDEVLPLGMSGGQGLNMVFPCLTWVLSQSNRGLAPSLCLRCWPLPRMECGIALFSAEQTTQEEAGPTWKAFTHVTWGCHGSIKMGNL